MPRATSRSDIHVTPIVRPPVKLPPVVVPDPTQRSTPNTKNG